MSVTACPQSPATSLPMKGQGTTSTSLTVLSDAAPGFRGRVHSLRPVAGSLPAEELERRLVEFGFVEGAMVELLHQGLIGRDPIAVRVDGVTIALRRREAAALVVEPLGSGPLG
jgi:ferrous iron transport protein A